MQINSASIGMSSLLSLLAKPAAGASPASAAFSADSSVGSANSSAGAGQSLPANTVGAPTGGLSFETMLALQSIAENRQKSEAGQAEAPSHLTSAEQQFLDEAQKTPAERMRDDILKSLGLTEDDLNNMTPEDRAAAEEKIRKLVQEKIKQGLGADTQSTENQGAGQFIQEIA